MTMTSMRAVFIMAFTIDDFALGPNALKPTANILLLLKCMIYIYYLIWFEKD